MQYQFVQQLFSTPLDIIGDIHGEIDALNQLLTHLGYDESGNHPQNRKIIFVGDLCDRGPDSLAVIRRVKKLIENKNAQCVIGNHELNLLISSKREGNGWFFGSPHIDDEKNFLSKTASVEDKNWILDFLSGLPIALESEELRIVHACWHQAAIDCLKQSDFSSILTAYNYFQQQIKQQLELSGIAKQAQGEIACHAINDAQQQPPLLHNLAQKELAEQMQNPIKVISSGAEYLVTQPLYAGGKWRMIDRLAWWDHYTDHIPVVVGHYWRNFKTTAEKQGLFKHIDATQWFGANKNVFCVDYSVGKRFLDRAQQQKFSSQLAALRFPEKILMLESGQTYST